MARIRYWLGAAALGLVALAVFQSWRPAKAQQVKREALRPGLLAIHRNADGKTEIMQIEPTVALLFKKGEAAHPRLNSDGGTIRWEGYINLLRGGDYQFGANLAGAVTVTIDAPAPMKALDATQIKDEKHAVVEGPLVKLPAGLHPIKIDFKRGNGAARLEVFWKGPGFAQEPLPHFVLRHLPAKLPKKFDDHQLAERGRFLFEELSCANCHKADKQDKLNSALQPRMGPNLDKIGERKHFSYLVDWLTAPHDAYPGRVMPHVLSPGDQGKTEAYAILKYLESHGGPIKASKVDPKNKNTLTSIDRGKKLFTTVGCTTCHAEEGKKPAKKGDDDDEKKFSGALVYTLTGTATGTRHFPLKKLGAKTTPEQLSAFLANPMAHDPSGRMPSLTLDAKEANDLANYLCFGNDQAAPQAVPKAPSDEDFHVVKSSLGRGLLVRTQYGEQDVRDLGERLLTARRCVNCHQVAQAKKLPEKAASGIDRLMQTQSWTAGCLATQDDKRNMAPRYGFTGDERKSLAAFLAIGSKGAGSPSPTHEARVALQRFNCLACHQRDGEGGLSTDLVLELRKYEKPENAETVTPPNLTGVGHKLRTSWMREVLVKGGKARQWMSLRMPQFGEAHVGKLPESLAALEGAEPDDAIRRVEISGAKIQAGQKLIGKTSFGCISCHDIAGIANSGTRGPDLATTTSRVRYDWFRRWLESAQRMDPGTKMPTVFVEGKSTLDNILKGHADAQSDAMWAYLSLGPTLPLPEGISTLTKGLILTVKDRPQWLRTFMPETGSRTFALGYPGGVSASFDAAQCRLGYAWTGQYIDASPVWDNRGGAPAKVLGPRFWTAPPGCPWSANESNDPPNFGEQVKDFAYGAPVPEGKVYDGPYALNFEGFSTDAEGLITFRYRLDAGNNKTVKIRERPEPLRSSGGVGLARHFTVDLPARKNAWLHVADSTGAPKLIDEKGQVLPYPKVGSGEVPGKQALILPQDGGRVLVLSLAKGPEGLAWQLQKHDKGWRVLLRLSGGEQEAAVPVQVNFWSAYRDEPALLRELLSGK